MLSQISTVLAFVAFVSAIPFPRQLTRCDVSKQAINFPAGSAISVPAGMVPTFVTVGRGIQNYTCTAGAFVSTGAVASLYDASCLLVNDPTAFASIQDVALTFPRAVSATPLTPSSLLGALRSHPASIVSSISSVFLSKFLMGNHFFTSFAPVSKIEPVFDFQESLGSGDFVTMNKTASIPDFRNPTANVAWLQLTQVLQGNFVKGVFRVDTAGGQPASTACATEGANISVDYAAQYWFFE